MEHVHISPVEAASFRSSRLAEVPRSEAPAISAGVTAPQITPHEGNVYQFPTAVPDVQPQPGPRVESRIIKKVNGRDVRVMVDVRPDGTTVFDHQPQPVELYDVMMQKIAPSNDARMLPGYEYPATVLPSEVGIYHVAEDAIGNKRVLAEVYLQGDHYRNGVGERVPGEKTWTKRVKGYDDKGNTIYEDETRALVAFSTTPFKPGIVKGHLLRRGSMNGEYDAANRLYKRVTQDKDHIEAMAKIREDVEAHRAAQQQQMLKDAQNQEALN